VKETARITGQKPYEFWFTEISPCERPDFQPCPKGTKFSVLECPWNILNFYLLPAKTVCTQFRSMATMPDLSALFTVNSKSIPIGLN